MAKSKTKESSAKPVNSGAADEVLKEKDYFEVIGSKNRRFKLLSGQIVDFQFGVPKNALELYKSGKFKYIGLKKGAEVLFEKESKELIEKLIQQAPRKEDVAILKKAMS